MSRILKDFPFNRSASFTVASKEKAAVPAVSEAGAPAEPVETPEEILARAQAVLEHAARQAEEIRTEAFRRGLQEGREEGLAQAAQQTEEMLAAVRRVAEAAPQARISYINEAQGQLGTLALAIAEMLTARQLNREPESIADIVAAAIEAANPQGPSRLHVHPDDYAILNPHWQALAALQPADAPLTLVADKRISRGGCLIDSAGGTVDATLETRLAQIKAAFANLAPVKAEQAAETETETLE